MNTDQTSLARVLLFRPDHPKIKLKSGGVVRQKLTAKEAIVLFRSGDYRLDGTANRVRSIELFRQVPTWQACYRTTEAPALPVSPEYLDGLRYETRTFRFNPNDPDIAPTYKIFRYSIPPSDEDDPAKAGFMDDLKSKRMARERAECEQ